MLRHSSVVGPNQWFGGLVSRYTTDECGGRHVPRPESQQPDATATWVVLVLTLSLPVIFVAFKLLRPHQLALPDPYNNPYAGWSDWCLLAFFALTVTDAIAIASWRRLIAGPVLISAVAALALAALFTIWFVAGLVRFLSP